MFAGVCARSIVFMYRYKTPGLSAFIQNTGRVTHPHVLGQSHIVNLQVDMIASSRNRWDCTRFYRSFALLSCSISPVPSRRSSPMNSLDFVRTEPGCQLDAHGGERAKTYWLLMTDQMTSSDYIFSIWATLWCNTYLHDGLRWMGIGYRMLQDYGQELNTRV